MDTRGAVDILSPLNAEPILALDDPSADGPHPPPHSSYHHAARKTGDVELEKRVEDRIRELGLLDNKVILEKALAERLNDTLEKGDSIVGALKKCRRRSRLRDQVTSFSGEVRNVIRQEVVRDTQGNKTIYAVDILMGRFTKDVIYTVKGREVIVNGSTQSLPKLTKEIRMELPGCVDVTQVNMAYGAGVFKLQAPYRNRNSSCSSRGSERRLSLSSEASWASSESTGPVAENDAPV